MSILLVAVIAFSWFYIGYSVGQASPRKSVPKKTSALLELIFIVMLMISSFFKSDAEYAVLSLAFAVVAALVFRLNLLRQLRA